MQNLIEPAREYYGLSISELAEKIGVSTDQLKAWQNGDEEPTLEGIVSIANVLHLPVDFLLGRMK